MTLYTIVLGSDGRFRAIPPTEAVVGQVFGQCRPEDAARLVRQHQSDLVRWTVRGSGERRERSAAVPSDGIPTHRLMLGSHSHGKWRLGG